jgi:hypothetical protein
MVIGSALDQFLDPTTGWLTPQIAERIAEWRPDEPVRARILELGEKANSGSLTPDEAAEYERLIDEGDVIALLQARSRRLLESGRAHP